MTPCVYGFWTIIAGVVFMAWCIGVCIGVVASQAAFACSPRDEEPRRSRREGSSH